MMQTNRKSGLFKHSIWMLSGLVLLLVVASCAKPPQVEIDSAAASIEAAKGKEAMEYAPTEYRAAMDSLNAAQAEINTQAGKFALFRNYKVARRQALAAQAAGQAAADAAVKNKQLAKAEAERTLGSAVQAIADARALLDSPAGKKLMRAKEAKEAVQQIILELNTTESSLDNVRNEIAGEKYKVAVRLAQASLNKANGLRQELEDAVLKMTGGSKAVS